MDGRPGGRARRSALLPPRLRGRADDAPPPLQRGRRRIPRGPPHLHRRGQRQGRPQGRARRERAPRGPLRVGAAAQRPRRAARSAHQRDGPRARDVDVQGLERLPRVVRRRDPRLHRAGRAGARARGEAHEGQDDTRREAARPLRLRRRRHPLRELRERRVVAAQPPAAAARATRGGLRRQGHPPHHAAEGRRHRCAGGHGADAAHERAVDRAREGCRRTALRSRHRVPAGTGRRDVPRRDEPAVAPRAAAVDGRARRCPAHGRAGGDGVPAVEQPRRARHRRRRGR